MELRLNPADNPAFKGLLDERIALGKAWDELNDRVLKYKRSVLWLGGIPKSLLQIGQEVREYEKRWSVWDRKARQFALDPRLTIEGDKESQGLTFLHYTGVLQWTIATMNSNMRLIQLNYNMTCEHFFNQRNLVLSWLGIALGIAFGLAGLWLSLEQ